MVKDMTNGSPSKHILGFAVPMLFGMLFQQFYNLVDTIIVGKTLGVEALAGVGATGSASTYSRRTINAPSIMPSIVTEKKATTT